MPKPVVFVGAATYDAIAMVEHHPGADERIIADAIVYAGGGPAATAAVAAHRLGIDVELVAGVGSDAIGSSVAADLTAEGISPAHLQVEDQRETQASVIMCSRDTAARSIATRGISPLHLTPANAELVRNADWVHVDHLGWPAVAEVLRDVPAEKRPKLLVDAGNALVGDDALCDLAEVHVYAPPREKLAERFGDRSDEDLLRVVPSHSVVATMGSDGSIARDADGNMFAAAGYTVEDFGSTLGAGDVFHGALTAAIVRHQPLLDALRYANAVAALACRGIDGRSTIPDHAEVTAFLERHANTL